MNSTDLRVMVPALTLWDKDGRVDGVWTKEYARRAGASWFDRFLISGSIGDGRISQPRDRRETLQVWAQVVAPARLLACVWCPEDWSYITSMGITPVMVLRDLRNDAELLACLRDLPKGAFVYGHPDYTQWSLTPEAVRQAREGGFLPRGCKLSHVGLDTLRGIREAAGPDFELFDGSSRNIRGSLEAGATGVVALPFCIFPEPMPARHETAALQALLDKIRSDLAPISGFQEQAKFLRSRLSQRLLRAEP